jgi:hypothetical protein
VDVVTEVYFPTRAGRGVHGGDTALRVGGDDGPVAPPLAARAGLRHIVAAASSPWPSGNREWRSMRRGRSRAARRPHRRVDGHETRARARRSCRGRSGMLFAPGLTTLLVMSSSVAKRRVNTLDAFISRSRGYRRHPSRLSTERRHHPLTSPDPPPRSVTTGRFKTWARSIGRTQRTQARRPSSRARRCRGRAPVRERRVTHIALVSENNFIRVLPAAAPRLRPTRKSIAASDGRLHRTAAARLARARSLQVPPNLRATKTWVLLFKVR